MGQARTGSLSAEVAAWLTTQSAAEHLEAASGQQADGSDALQLGMFLRDRGLTAPQANAVVDVVLARGRAAGEWSHANELLLTLAGLEQASHPAVSRWRARRFRGQSPVVDLCAGIGADSLALAEEGCAVTSVDRDRARLRLLAHNARRLRADVQVVVGDALRPPVRVDGPVHADPSRRPGGRRVSRLADYEPPVPALLRAVAEAAGAAVVVSPAVRLGDPALPVDAELEFVQVGTDLVEAVLWLGSLRSTGRVASATLLPAGLTRHRAASARPLPVGEVGSHLLEVEPAAVRARLHDELGGEVDARRIATRRAILTADDPPPSPWWVRWEVEEVLPARPRQVRAWLREAPSAPLTIAVHGLDADPDDWWRKLGRPTRGPNGRRLHLLRTDEGGIAVAATRVEDAGDLSEDGWGAGDDRVR